MIDTVTLHAFMKGNLPQIITNFSCVNLGLRGLYHDLITSARVFTFMSAVIPTLFAIDDI